MNDYKAQIELILDSLEFFDHNSEVEHAYFEQTTASLLKLLDEARIDAFQQVVRRASKEGHVTAVAYARRQVARHPELKEEK